MAYILRVETAAGYGAYQGDHIERAAVMAGLGIKSVYAYGERHPAPHHDGLPLNGPEYYFGFASFKQFTDWFHPRAWRKGMREVGMDLWVYDIPDRRIRFGGKQCMFRGGKRCRKVQKFPPDVTMLRLALSFPSLVT